MQPKAIVRHLNNLQKNPLEVTVCSSVLLPNAKMVASRTNYIQAKSREIETIEDLRHWANRHVIANKAAFNTLSPESGDMIALDVFA